MDWDTWIRQHLTKSKCAMAFWSASSVSSDNVRHEAMVAKQQGKLISVLLEPLTAEQFPMGLYAQQAANLSDWSGDDSHQEWRKFRREFEAKLTPLWVRGQIDEIEAELVGERTRREGAERRDRTMQAQIAKEVETQQVLKRERDGALDEIANLKMTVEDLTRARAEAAALEVQVKQDLKQGRDMALADVAALKATVGELTQAQSESEARQAPAQRRHAAPRSQIAKEVETQQVLKRERDGALDEVAALKGMVEELTQARQHAEASAVELSQRLRKVRQSKAQEIARSIGAAFSPFVIAAAVATAGFWTYQLIGSTPQSLLAVPIESSPEWLAAIKEEAQRHAKAAADAEAKLKAAEAEQQRLNEEVERQTKAAADADFKRKTAEAEQQRLIAKAEEERKAGLRTAPPASPAILPSVSPKSAGLSSSTSTSSFERLSNMRNNGSFIDGARVRSVGECEEKCRLLSACKVFSFDKITVNGWCGLYSAADLIPHDKYDSGIRK